MIHELTNYVAYFKNLALTCGDSGFLGFPTWYKYLSGSVIDQQITGSDSVKICQPALRNINDIWLVVAAVLEMLLRVGALASIGFIIWGGIQLMTSQGDSNGVKAARETIQNAVIGLIITILAAVLVNFVAGRFNAL